MPTLAAALDLAKLEARNLRAHQLAAAPASPVTGQLYYNTGDNTLYWYNGTAWVSAAGGGGADATTSSKGIIQLAGDLAGTAASPQLAAGSVNSAEVAAAIKDPVTTLAGLRTLGLGAQQAFPGDGRLDQVANPTAARPMNGQPITNMADPTNGQDAATKTYVDSVAAGLSPKDSVACATTAPVNIGTPNTASGIDGIVLWNTAGGNRRVLVKNQANQAENGIYYVSNVVLGVSFTLARATDFDSWTEVPGASTWVEEGVTNADTGWVCTADAGGTLGTTAITWTQHSGLGQVTAGAGLTKAGNTLDVGAGAGITVNADSVQVANDGITNAMVADGVVNLATADVTGTLPLTKGGTGQTAAKAARETGLVATGYYSSATHGAGTTITITAATHGLRASRGLIVQVQLEADGSVLLADIAIASNGDVTVTFAVSQSANTIRVTVIG
jgi:hypothetical protein